MSLQQLELLIVNARNRFCHSDGWLTCDDFDRRHLVLGTVGRPVRVLGRDDVGAGFREVERRVHDARTHAIGDVGVQHDFTRPARHADPVAVLDAAHLGIVRVDLEHVLRAQATLFVRRVCAPTLYCVRMRPVVRISGYRRVVRSVVGM